MAQPNYDLRFSQPHRILLGFDPFRQIEFTHLDLKAEVTAPGGQTKELASICKPGDKRHDFGEENPDGTLTASARRSNTKGLTPQEIDDLADYVKSL